jgi:hypothetical protein
VVFILFQLSILILNQQWQLKHIISIDTVFYLSRISEEKVKTKKDLYFYDNIAGPRIAKIFL